MWNAHRSKWLTPSGGCLDVNTKYETKLSWILLCSYFQPHILIRSPWPVSSPLWRPARTGWARAFLTWPIPKSPWVSILSRGHSWLGWFMNIYDDLGYPPWLRKPPVGFDPSPHQNASFFTMWLRRLRFAASLRQLEDMAPATGNQERRPWAFFYPLDMVIDCILLVAIYYDKLFHVAPSWDKPTWMIMKEQLREKVPCQRCQTTALSRAACLKFLSAVSFGQNKLWSPPRGS